MNKHFGMRVPAKAAERGAPFPADAGPMEAGPAHAMKRVRVSAREADGSVLPGRATLIMGRGGRPEKIELRNCIPPTGDVLLAQDGRGGAYHLTLKKGGRDLEMRTRISNGFMLVQEFTITKSMRIRGCLSGAEYMAGGKDGALDSCGDMSGQTGMEELANAVQGCVQELTREEILRAKFTFRDKTEITGAELLGNSPELGMGQIRITHRGEEFAANVLSVENAERTIRLMLVQREVKDLPDLEAMFQGAKRRPIAFSAEIGGYMYAGVMV